MRIKSYFVKSVDEAIEQARQELGSEALLLNTRRLMQAGKPNGYEVVLGVNEPLPSAEPVAAAVPPKLPEPQELALSQESLEPKPVPYRPAELSLEVRQEPVPVVRQRLSSNQLSGNRISGDLQKLRAQMDEIQELLLRSTRSEGLAGRVVPELGPVFSSFLDQQVDPLLAKDIVVRVEAAMSTDAFFQDTSLGEREKDSNSWKVLRPAAQRLEKFLRAELQKRIAVVPELGIAGGTMSPVTILVGPTGGGKTTTVAKLAVAASSQAPIRLLSLDRSRPGASQQLRALATGPRIAFAAVNTLERLPEVFHEARKGHGVLVDTAGYAESQWSGAEQLAEVLANCPELDVHLAVPAYMNAADFRRVLDRYKIFKPSKLLVTKMDEAQTFGCAFSEAVRAGLALSFITNGPRVPNDIQAASLDDLVALGMQQTPRGARRAA